MTNIKMVAGSTGPSKNSEATPFLNPSAKKGLWPLLQILIGVIPPLADNEGIEIRRTQFSNVASFWCLYFWHAETKINAQKSDAQIGFAFLSLAAVQV